MLLQHRHVQQSETAAEPRNQRTFGRVRAFVVGTLVGLQGIFNGKLGAYFGGSYQHAGMVSLGVSTGGFLVLAVLQVLFWPLLRRREKSGSIAFVAIARMIRNATWWQRLIFLISGFSGACYVVVFPATSSVATSAAAMVMGVAGIVSFPVIASWRTLGKARRFVLIGVFCMAAATLLVAWGSVNSPIQAASGWEIASMLTLTYFCGLGVGWQFTVIGKMRQLSSSNLGAGLVSSVSGLLATGLLVYGMSKVPFLGDWQLIPDQPLPNPWSELWYLYNGGLAGFGLIFMATFAVTALIVQYKEKLGRAVYLFVMALGALTTIYLVNLATDVLDGIFVFQVTVLSTLGCVLAAVSVYFCVLKIGQVVNRTTEASE